MTNQREKGPEEMTDAERAAVTCPPASAHSDAAILERFRLAIANASKDTPPGFEQHWNDTYQILARELSTLGVQQLGIAALFCDDSLAANPEAPRSVVFRLAAEAMLRGVVLMIRSARKLDGLEFEAARFGLFCFAVAEACDSGLAEGTEHAEFPSAYRPGDFRKFIEAESLNAEQETALLRARVRELEAGARRAAQLCRERDPKDGHRWSGGEVAEYLDDILASDVKPMDLAFALRLADQALTAAGWPAGFVQIISSLAADPDANAKRLGKRLERQSIVTSIAEHLRNNV